MRDTLEDKIMGLQRFKMDVANAAVNQDNVSLSAMDTSKLLDLFAVSDTPQTAQQPDDGQLAASALSEAEARSVGNAGGGMKAMMKGLGELADESQYAEEFSLDSFLHKLGQA